MQSRDNTLYTFGNGKMLVYGNGTSLHSIQGPIYSSPAFCSVVACLRDEEHSDIYTTTERVSKTNIRTHDVYFDTKVNYSTHDSYSPDVHITDMIDPRRCIFLRSIESFEKLRHRIIISRGAHYSIARAYPIKGRKYTVGIITIPRGTPYYNGECTNQECRLLIIPVGEAKFSDSGNEIISDAGVSGILFVTGDNCEDIISSAAYAIKSASTASAVGECKIYLDCVRHWRSRLKPISAIAGCIPSNHKERERILKTAENVIILLLSHISHDGAIISSSERPVMYYDDTDITISVLSSLGYTAEAKRILNFINCSWERHCCLSAGEGSEINGVPVTFKNAVDDSRTPACIINSVFCYYERTRDTAFVKKLMPMLIWASRALCGAVNHSALTFSGGERGFEYGILPLSIAQQSSFESTMLAVIAARRLITFVNEHSLRNRSRYYTPLEHMLNDIEPVCRKRFFSDGYISCNDPMHGYRVRHSRFYYGYCESCAERGKPVYKMWLERNKNGIYVCPSCYNQNEIPENKQQDWIQLCSASALPAYYDSRLFTVTEKLTQIETYIKSLTTNGFVPATMNSTLMSGDDPGKLLGALNRIIMSGAEKNTTSDLAIYGDRIITSMLNLTDETGVWAGLYEVTSPLRDRCDSAASSYNLCAILDYFNFNRKS